MAPAQSERTSRSGVPMADFTAFVSASLDHIGAGIDSGAASRPLLPTNQLGLYGGADIGATPRPPTRSPHLAPSNGARHAAVSFIRKVKSHAASLIQDAVHGPGTSTAHLASLSASGSEGPEASLPSFIPLAPSRSATPVPFARSGAKSLPRNVFARTFGTPRPTGKRSTHLDTLEAEPKGSFFDDDDSDDDGFTKRGPRPYRPSRRVTSAPSRPYSRLSSALESAPSLFTFSEPSTSAPQVTEYHSTSRSDFGANLEAPKSSLVLRLRTKLSRSKLATPHASHTYLPSPSTDGPSPITPSSDSHTYSYASVGYKRSHPYGAPCDERSITPEQDPFRKDDVVYAVPITPRIHDSSPWRGSLQDSNVKHRQLITSRSVPKLSSRWSLDSESPPPSPRASSTDGSSSVPPSPNLQLPCTVTLPSSNILIPPLSLTFPLPPSAQDSVPLPGVTLRMITPAPSPPPAYPPPLRPPSSSPPHFPSSVSQVRALRSRSPSKPQQDISSRRRSRSPPSNLTLKLATSRQHRWRSREGSPSIFASELSSPASDVTTSVADGFLTNHQDHSLTPSPLSPREGNFFAVGLEVPDVATSFIDPWNETLLEVGGDAMANSEVEPDWDFDTDKARKKASVSSTTSTDSSISSSSSTSVSTTTSFRSVTTFLTAATTVSPSTSPSIGTDKASHVPKVFITDEDGETVDAEMPSVPLPQPISHPSAWHAAQSTGLYIKRDGALTVAEAPASMALIDGEPVTIGSCGWEEFRNYCDTYGDTSFRLSDSPNGFGTADISVIELQQGGRTCGVELQMVPRFPRPLSIGCSGRMPGSYPLSLDLSSLLPAIPHISPIDIPQSAWSDWGGSALGLEGVPPPRETGSIVPFSPSISELRLGSDAGHADCVEVEQRMTVLAFTEALPATLRDLARRAGRMSLFEGVVSTQDNPYYY
ncbi:hypothetical protein BC834DRAFT_860898 [Gloeopeniophorella convolvens]|nr:hypothetical protein BC834DRAFT_860898 [Gloeopeniophorella convolvens]